MHRFCTARMFRASIAIIGVAAVLGVVTFLLSTGPTQAETNDWPAFTMVYDVDGQTWNGKSIREVRAFVYNSETDWTDTVTSSDAILSGGTDTIYSTGSYRSLNGREYSEYDAIHDELTTETVDEGVRRVPNGFLVPIPVAHMKSALTNTDEGGFVAKTTTAKVCYRKACKDNAAGAVLPAGSEDLWGGDWVFLDDPRWGIALKAGDLFTVRQLVLEADPMTPPAE